MYLIEDGQTIFLWVGRDSVPQLIIDVFNLPNYEVLRGGKVSVISVCFGFFSTCMDVAVEEQTSPVELLLLYISLVAKTLGGIVCCECVRCLMLSLPQ